MMRKRQRFHSIYAKISLDLSYFLRSKITNILDWIACQNWTESCIYLKWSRCKGRAWAAVDCAGQYVSIISRYPKRVIHFTISALFVLEQQIWMIKCCQLHKSMVIIPEDTPFSLDGGKIWKACSSSSSSNVYSSIQGTFIRVLLVVCTNILR